jgi:hypothetical protein
MALAAGRLTPAVTCPNCRRRYRLVRRFAANGADSVGRPGGRGAGQSASDEVALAGADGRQAARLLAAAKQRGAERLTQLARPAVRRLLRGGGAGGRLFSEGELADLASQLSATLATAELLGRARVRIRQKRVAGGTKLFAEQPTPYKGTFAPAPIEPLPPSEALRYFRSLVPELGTDPRVNERFERSAFTLAVQTDEVVLSKVKGVIAQALESGTGGAADIDAILDAAGVGPRRKGYSDMVWRTNCQDAYQTGSWRELQEPDVQEVFSHYRYLGVRDGREGDDHRPNFDRYFPTSRPFAEAVSPPWPSLKSKVSARAESKSSVWSD